MVGMVRERRMLIVDAHGLIYRAYHAMPVMTNKQGECIQVAYGFTSMLLQTLNQGFDFGVAAFDHKDKTIRRQKLETYKATRKPTPKELIDQIPLCYKIAELLNLSPISLSGYEADDIIGTLTKQANLLNIKTTILSNDMDLFQLINEDTSIQTSTKTKDGIIKYDVPTFVQRFKFQPQQMVDYKALRGDTSDNIPGIVGIGEKTATSLVQKYGKVEELIKSIPYLPEDRVKRALAGQEKNILFNKELVQIDTQVPGVKLNINEKLIKDYDKQVLILFLKEHGMPGLLSRLPSFPEAQL